MRLTDDIKRPAARKVFFASNPNLAARLDKARARKAQSERTGRNEDAAEADAQIDEILAECRGDVIAFYLTSIGREAYDELIKAHPPSQSQRNAYAKELKAIPEGQRPGPLRWNTETFAPALLSACIALPEPDELDDDDPPLDRWVEPPTPEEAEALWNSERWSLGELTTLQAAAMAVNAGGSVLELKGS
jgi:hypothetical protein